MQMKVFRLSVLDIMEPIMQSITFKIEVVTIRTKTDKNHPLIIFFSFSLLTIFLQVGCSRALKVIANGQSSFDCSLPKIHCYFFSLSWVSCFAWRSGVYSMQAIKDLRKQLLFLLLFMFQWAFLLSALLYRAVLSPKNICRAQEPFAELSENLVIKKKIIKPEYFHKDTFLAPNFCAATDIERNIYKFINSHQSAWSLRFLV